MRGVDDWHQFHAAIALQELFPEAVLAPIRLHVDAKRHLCAIDSAYRGMLSLDSRRSLELQGGRYGAAGSKKFLDRNHADDAISLRRWDDLVKVAGKKTPKLKHYLDIAALCAAR